MFLFDGEDKGFRRGEVVIGLTMGTKSLVVALT